MRILFLCTGNSCRSQMAEGWMNHLHGPGVQAFSAGVRAGRLDPRAVQVMLEAGVDIRSQRSKHVSEVLHLSFDVVVTLCDHARETCPLFPRGTRVFHRGFDDPPAITADWTSEDAILDVYRRVRDEIRHFTGRLPIDSSF